MHSSSTITALCPTRVDFAGGTLDLWPIFNCLSQKATVNGSLGLYAKADLSFKKSGAFELSSLDQNASRQGDFKTLSSLKGTDLDFLSLFLKNYWQEDLPPIRLTTLAGSPKGAGLGGSSCLGIAILAAFQKAKHLLDSSNTMPKTEELVTMVQGIESSLIHSPAGIQDYWGGLRGGINLITYPPKGPLVSTLKGPFLEAINQTMIVCFSGESRFSGINNWEVYKRFFEKDLHITEALEAIGKQAENCAAACLEKNIDGFLEASQKEWHIRKEMWPKIETDQTKRLDLAAKKSGAFFTRICGAGGGGVMLAFAQPKDHEAIRWAMKKEGGRILEASLVETGLKILVDGKDE